jgi:hypothetical protein
MTRETFADRADEYEDAIAMCVLHNPAAALSVPNGFRFTNAHRQRIFDHVLRGGSLVVSDMEAELGRETGRYAIEMLSGFGCHPVNLPNMIRVCLDLRARSEASRAFGSMANRLAPRQSRNALRLLRV